MNKSKFLKKSLAMLLALMLVLAMIPLSASAAPAPTVSKIEVNGVEVDPETLSAEITDPAGGDVNVTVQLQDGKGSVAYYTELQDKNPVDQGHGVWTFTLDDEDVAAGKFTFTTIDTDGVQKENYTVTFTTVARDADTSVESVVLNGGKMYDVWSDNNGATVDYTIVAPYGYDIDNGSVTVKPTSDKATVYDGNNKEAEEGVVATKKYDAKYSFKVKAENGKEATYTVTIVEPIPFASFSIEDERREAQIDRVTEDPSFQVDENVHPQVEVYLPYDAEIKDGKFYFTPEFTTNYEEMHVYMLKRADTNQPAANAEKVELISGETYNLGDFDPLAASGKVGNKRVYMVVEYSDGSVENWQLLFHQFTSDSVAAIKELRVDNYPATIDETTTPPTITLTIPASVRESKKLDVKVSAGMEILLVGTTEKLAKSKTTDGYNPWTWKSNDLTKDEYTLRVTAPQKEVGADAVQVKDYKLVVETAEVAEPKLNSISLQREDTNETVEGVLVDDHTYYFDEIPYRIKNLADFESEEWQLFWNATSGAKVTYKQANAGGTSTEKPIAVSGAIVDDAWTYLPTSNRTVGQRFVDAASKITIDVTIENKTVSYTLVFNSAEASTVSALGDVWLAKNEVTKLDDLNEDNHTKAVVDNGKISAEIYYNQWEEYNLGTGNDNTELGGAKIKTTLPTGAKIYFVNQNGKYKGELVEFATLGEEPITGLDNIPSVDYNTSGTGNKTLYRYGNTWNIGKGQYNNDYKTALQIVVVSEAAVEKVPTYKTIAALKTVANGQFTVYDLTLKQKQPRHEVELKTFGVYDDYTGTSITAQIVDDQINLTLPAYMVDEHRKSEDNLYLNYGPKDGGQTVQLSEADGDKITGVDNLEWLKTKEDGSYDLSAGKATQLTWDKDKGLMVDDDKLEYVQVTAEDTSPRKAPYKVNITIADANTKAVLNSVSYNGSTATPNADREVALSVPFNTEVTSMALDFDISENAYVLEGKWEVADLSALKADKKPIVDEDETFNFLQTRTFTVVSEDNQETETYEITVVPAETFNDVTPDWWYYDEVMTAANKGWINGMRPGYFEPNGTMTRGQFATIIARILNYNPDNYPNTAFPDVPSDIYYSEAVAFCKENNIIDGDDKGNFNGEDPITREQMAKILCQALQLKVTVPEDKFDDDAKIAEWAKGYVYACQEAGIMEGDNGSFRPTDNATRAEGAAVLVRAFA